MEDRRHYVYEHLRFDRKEEGEVFYTGKGCGSRAYDFSARNVHHGRVVKKLIRLGIPPAANIVMDALTEDEAFMYESTQLRHRKDECAPLTNIMDGGDGFCVRWARRASAKSHSVKTPDGKSALGVRNGHKSHSVKTEEGKSVLGVRNAARMHARKIPDGKSAWAVSGAAAVHLDKGPDGKSNHAKRLIRASLATSLAPVLVSTGRTLDEYLAQFDPEQTRGQRDYCAPSEVRELIHKDSDAVVIPIATSNPKKPGSKAYRVWDSYAAGGVVRDIIPAIDSARASAGMRSHRGARSELLWAVAHGLIRIVPTKEKRPEQ